MPLFSLPERLRLAPYGNAFYLFDQKLAKNPLLQFQTQRLDKSLYRALNDLFLARLHTSPRSEQAIRELLAQSGHQPSLFSTLATHQWLVPVAEVPPDSPEDKLLARFAKETRGDDKEAIRLFETTDLPLSFAPRSLFNVPAQVDLIDCDVAVIGLEIATLQANVGAAMGPDHLRALSSDVNWLQTTTQGFYSELAMDRGFPEVIGQNVVFADLGNIPSSDHTLEHLFSSIQAQVDRLQQATVRPLFIGGDHAITFPIVKALLEQRENLHLLHLDAHNDLFYNRDIQFIHSAPISNLMRTTPLQKVLSFGLRTFHDQRADHVTALNRQVNVEERLALHSLLETKRQLLIPEKLRASLRAFKGMPFYLTIDLDVLSDTAIGNQLATPMGPGLEWHELFAFIHIAFEELEIIGCDINEFNALRGTTSNATAYYLKTLLILLLDRLAKQNRLANQSSLPAAGNDPG